MKRDMNGILTYHVVPLDGSEWDGMGMSSWVVLFVWRCFIHDLDTFSAINMVMGSRSRNQRDDDDMEC